MWVTKLLVLAKFQVLEPQRDLNYDKNKHETQRHFDIHIADNSIPTLKDLSNTKV